VIPVIGTCDDLAAICILLKQTL